MDQSEQLRQLVIAQIYAYVALVNALRDAGAVDPQRVVDWLGRFSDAAAVDQALVTEVLRGLQAAIAGGKPDGTAFDRLFH